MLLIKMRLFILSVLFYFASAKDVRDFCQNEVFPASCGKNEVIVMKTAQYGRMRLSRCVDRNYGYISCHRDVLREADILCSGKRECEIQIPNNLLDSTNPCPKDLKSYLEARYDCLPVTDVDGEVCGSTPIPLTSSSGYLASIVTKETSRGSSKCPWLIQAKRGQRVNITLFDFSSLRGSAGCHAYAMIREKLRARQTTVCGGAKRLLHAYTSISHQVEVRVVSGNFGHNSRQFLLKYEIFGCEDPSLSAHTSLKRKGNEAEIGCSVTGETWHVTCKGNTWVGRLGNCSSVGSSTLFDKLAVGSSALPLVPSLIVILGIALFLGLIILIIGLLILRWKRRRARPYRNREPVYESSNKSEFYQRPAVLSQEHRKDGETLYQSSENEYAYISDPPPPLNVENQNRTNRQVELYQARKCHDYGTRNVNPKPEGAFQTRRLETDTPRYVESSSCSLGEPPTYFELDPEADANGASGRACSGSPSGTNAHGYMGIKREQNDSRSAMKRTNQSAHDFSANAYDHLVDQVDQNSNHKSV